jgi:hypothetical protein
VFDTFSFRLSPFLLIFPFYLSLSSAARKTLNAISHVINYLQEPRHFFFLFLVTAKCYGLF